MKAFALRTLALVAVFALYIVNPILGFIGLAGAFGYVFAQRFRSTGEPGIFLNRRERGITSLT